MIPVIGLGAGGHAKVLIDALNALGGYDLVALLDPCQALWGTEVLGVTVRGDDTLLAHFVDQGIHVAFLGVGSAGNTTVRQRLYATLRHHGFQVVSVIHPQACIAPTAVVGSGVSILAGAIINAHAHIGENVLVNTGAIIEHDCTIGDHGHVATGARLAGGVTVGMGSHIGIGASVRQGVQIGTRSIIGAGAVVVADVPDAVTVVGVPATILRKGSPDG